MTTREGQAPAQDADEKGHVHVGEGGGGPYECAWAEGYLHPQASVAPHECANAGHGGSDVLHLPCPQMAAARLTYLPWGLKRWWN